MMIRLKYKDFEFLQNPAEISVEKSKDISERSLLSAGSAVEEIAEKAAKITICGRFYGAQSAEAAAKLTALHDDTGAGPLVLPDGEFFSAYFSSLLIKQNAAENSVEYELGFTEEKSGRNYKKRRRYVFAESGENCFDIAAANSVKLEKIMELNGFKTPFDLQEGQRVRIR